MRIPMSNNLEVYMALAAQVSYGDPESEYCMASARETVGNQINTRFAGRIVDQTQARLPSSILLLTAIPH